MNLTNPPDLLKIARFLRKLENHPALYDQLSLIQDYATQLEHTRPKPQNPPNRRPPSQTSDLEPGRRQANGTRLGNRTERDGK